MVSFPREFELLDGTTFQQGAGSGSGSGIRFDYAEERGQYLIYHFKYNDPLSCLLGFSSFSEHCAQGTIVCKEELRLFAQVGGSNATFRAVGTISGNTDCVGVDPRRTFHPFALPIGARTVVSSTITLCSGVWQTNTFDADFRYTMEGYVDFTKEAEAGTELPVPDDVSPRYISWRGRLLYDGNAGGVPTIVASPRGTDPASVSNVALNSEFVLSFPAGQRYSLSCWMDVDGNGTRDVWEPQASRDADEVLLQDDVSWGDTTLIDPDDDKDGLPDWWEMRLIAGRDTPDLHKIEQLFPSGDFDGDGISNREEYRYGTDASDPASAPPRVQFACATQSFGEGTGGAAVQLHLAPPCSTEVTALIRVSRRGSAKESADFVVPAKKIVFTPGQTVQKVDVVLLPDDAREQDESAILEIEGISGQATTGQVSNTTIVIRDSFEDTDNDSLPDTWERENFGDLSASADQDADRDGWDNRREYLRGGNARRSWKADSDNELGLELGVPAPGPWSESR